MPQAVIDCPISGMPRSVEYHENIFGAWSLGGCGKELAEASYTGKIESVLEKLTNGKWNNIEQFVQDNLLAKPGTMNCHFYIRYEPAREYNNILLNKGKYFETTFMWENEYKIKRHILRKMCEPFGIDFSHFNKYGTITGNKRLLPHYVAVVEKLTGYKPHVYMDWI